MIMNFVNDFIDCGNETVLRFGSEFPAMFSFLFFFSY
ncbi:hypothetical protein POTTS_68 [Klebsiella phage vB_KpnM_Potts1]|jgi:hypothetical protein|uniref:Uncharacterized protein n=1 Tax=Klebsiella phage vB_KpnM_Potts1 TaxID=2591366 RepID=A0A5B9NF61_9CAUD|nr:hypothetical protein POTTS_68 [Klebsiella phage vB_KpnM_Potts1]